MSKFLQAVLVSAAATGVAAVLLKVTSQSSTPRRRQVAPRDPFVDADQFSPAEREALLDELDAQL